MSAFLKALFQKYATRLIIGTGEGIKQIPNKDRVNRMVANLYNDFKAAGVTDNMIKSEADVKSLHIKVNELYEANLARNLKDVLKPKKSADVLDLTGKKIDTSKPILGGKNVTESGMLDDNYKELKKEWFGRIIANEDDAINTFLKRGINQADERFVSLSKDQRKDFLDMVEYRLKHGNVKFMEDSQMFFKKQNGIDWKKVEETDLDEFAYGGLAGMLGERTGYFTGALADTKKGKRMSPGTSANFRSTEVPWYLKKMDESDITYGQTGSEHPEELIKKEIKKKVKKRQDIAEEALLAEQESKQNKIFKDVEKYKHLAKNKILVHVQENFRSKPISKQLLDKIVDLTLEYPDIKIFNKYGAIDEDKLKQVIDQAVMDAKIHPVDGLTLTQSITPEGAPSGIGLSYEGDNVTLDYPDVSKGDYSVGFNYNLKDNPLLKAKIPQGVRNPGGDLRKGIMSKAGDLKLVSELGVEDDILKSRKIGFDYGDGILSASQTTLPNEKLKINEATLNKKFNLTDNIGFDVKGT